MTEETLSDELRLIEGTKEWDYVKKFIKEVKYPKPDMALTIENLHKWIDKLAGDDLI